MERQRKAATVRVAAASRRHRGGSFGSWSPLLKQVAALVGFVLANLVLLSPVVVEVVPALVIAADALVLAAAAFAFVLPRSTLNPAWELAVPVVTFAAVALLRVGTGGQASPFAALMVIPLVWIASEPGVRSVVIAAVGVVVTICLPFFVGVSAVTSPADAVRLVFTPMAFTIAAVLINQIARVVNRRVQQLEELNAERDRLVETLERANRAARKRELQAINANALLDGVWNDITGHAIIGTDRSGLVTVWNPGAASLLGYTAEEAIARLNITELHRRDELRDFAGLVGTARSGLRDVRDWTYSRKDGTVFPAQVSIAERLDEEGEPAGFVFVATDETDAKEIERLKDEFAGLISHELRTPLSSILGYVELLRSDDDEPLTRQQDKYLGVVERNARRLLQLVGDLLFTAQVDSGGFRVRPVPTDLPTVLRAALESARPVAESAGVELRSDVGEGELRLGVDPVRLGQAVDNILSNAVKFTPRGGSVTVGLESAPDEVRIVVADTGYGIAEHELHRLSERFFRAGTATKNAVQGVGLGLTITKAIVTAHGGRIDISSVLGEGTSIAIALPRASISGSAARR
ncbi:PAS domain-containing sensor histidine kinase [Herbiconiux sp. CPCC 205716]|uniref:histidine kinase n=1 Tax=Herbiconiux gentiana TaxID=2970912 RepID=A0ABT2GAW7_9MICO|nr:PAS domain-containing sensor histidine kinase [Herbiconiux gentiana]MCS5713338.1 PAS domain-containing sensor histidine kinase [Herbiconiux gentiana]